MICLPFLHQFTKHFFFCNLEFGFVSRSVTDVVWFVLFLNGVCMNFNLNVLCFFDRFDVCRFVHVILWV